MRCTLEGRAGANVNCCYPPFEVSTKLVCTQGVWERDEWRSEDSFETFSEVLAIAKAEAMDFVLLGGDLFHENKPSRKTLINTLQIMHNHCLGMEPVSFQVERLQLEIGSHALPVRAMLSPTGSYEWCLFRFLAPRTATTFLKVQIGILKLSTRLSQRCML